MTLVKRPHPSSLSLGRHVKTQKLGRMISKWRDNLDWDRITDRGGGCRIDYISSRLMLLFLEHLLRNKRVVKQLLIKMFSAIKYRLF